MELFAVVMWAPASTSGNCSDRQSTKHHPKILPLGRAHAGDKGGEIPSRLASVVVPRILLREAFPIEVASCHRLRVRVIDIAGQRDGSRYCRHYPNMRPHRVLLFSIP